MQTCPVAHLALEAAAIIRRFDQAGDEELARLVELEEAAINLTPSSRIGVIFQTAIIATLADGIQAALPADSRWTAQTEEHLRSIDQMARSIVASLASSPATDDEREICSYYLPERMH